MRLWTLHPKYLDTKGLLAVWREALLAQAVLLGRTRGYTRHPQLARFRASRSPAGFIARYLRAIRAEAVARGYRFDAGKINGAHAKGSIPVGTGQVEFEKRHLARKLRRRDPSRLSVLLSARLPDLNPVFRAVGGGIETWEKSTKKQGGRSAGRM
ncbi:MAG: pyrimidine dimer DNA glycosylase/endonuclease V [Planctomycetota bacterium]|nr:pyrimidine dimer DNA glycosylase/endonuclease V [Planctomycetota bacterium]